MHIQIWTLKTAAENIWLLSDLNVARSEMEHTP